MSEDLAVLPPVKLAVVGFGKWGRNHARAARASGHAVVSHIVTSRPMHHVHPSTEGRTMDDVRRDSDAAGDALTFFGRLGLEQALDEADAAVYAGHPSGAVGVCEAALKRGKPILVEKPAGLSREEAEAICEAERASTAWVLVGHQHLFSERAEFLVGASSIAPVCARWHGPEVHDFPHLWDYGPHAVSLILAIRKRMPDTWQWMVKLGSCSTLIMRYGEHKDRVHLCAQDEKQATLYAETRLRENSLEGPLLYDGYAPAEPSLTREVRAFAKAVREGRTPTDPRFGARWALDVARILSAAG